MITAMRKAILSFGSLVLTTVSAMATAPLPESCTAGDRPFTRPLDEIGFFFDGEIKLLDGAVATVKCDGETVAISERMEVSNYTSSKRTQGSLAIFFDGRNLPKGKEYTLYVAPGSIASEVDGAENNEFTQTFSIPDNLGPARFDVEDGTTIAQTSRYDGGLYPCYWGIETEAVGEPSFILFREGVAVREFPAYITWDWDLGQAYPKIEGNMRFEKGVHYSLVLPAGSAHAMYRDDIVNEEVTLNFIGGYEETVPQLNYVWCNLFTEHSDVLNVVSFTYDRPVRVAEGAKLQLWEIGVNKLVKEVDAYLDSETNCWVVSADFDGFQMQPEVGYTFVIPEGAVIAENGDPVVNPRNAIALNGSSGIENITINSTDCNITLYDMYGRKVKFPKRGTIYVQSGKKILIK